MLEIILVQFGYSSGLRTPNSFGFSSYSYGYSYSTLASGCYRFTLVRHTSKVSYAVLCYVGGNIDNRATKRNWKRAKNLQANAGKTPMMSRQILVSGVSVRRRGPLTRHTVVYLPRGSSTKRFLYIYNDIYNILVENCTMHSCELYFMQCRNAETIVSQFFLENKQDYPKMQAVIKCNHYQRM